MKKTFLAALAALALTLSFAGGAWAKDFTCRGQPPTGYVGVENPAYQMLWANARDAVELAARNCPGVRTLGAILSYTKSQGVCALEWRRHGGKRPLLPACLPELACKVMQMATAVQRTCGDRLLLRIDKLNLLRGQRV